MVNQNTFFAIEMKERSKSRIKSLLDCKTVVFGRFRKARSTVSVILACEAREPRSRSFLVSLAVFRLAPDLSFEY